EILLRCVRVSQKSVISGILQIGLAGFEPTTSCTPSKRASQAALQPVRTVLSIRTSQDNRSSQPFRRISGLLVNPNRNVRSYLVRNVFFGKAKEEPWRTRA